MDNEELSALIALQHIPGIGSITAKRLVESVGSASFLFEHRKDLRDLVPNVQSSLLSALDCRQHIIVQSRSWSLFISII